MARPRNGAGQGRGGQGRAHRGAHGGGAEHVLDLVRAPAVARAMQRGHLCGAAPERRRAVAGRAGVHRQCADGALLPIARLPARLRSAQLSALRSTQGAVSPHSRLHRFQEGLLLCSHGLQHRLWCQQSWL